MARSRNNQVGIRGGAAVTYAAIDAAVRRSIRAINEYNDRQHSGGKRKKKDKESEQSARSSTVFTQQGEVKKPGRKKKSKRKGASLKKKLNKLIKNMPKMSEHVYKNVDGKGVACAENQCGYQTTRAWDVGLLSSAVQNLRFVVTTNTVGPVLGTGVIDPVTFAKTFGAYPIKCYSECQLRNNTLEQNVVDVYCMDCKKDTNSSPDVLINTYQPRSLSIVTGGATNNTNVLMYPYDIPIMKEYWKCVHHEKVTLNPGDTYKMTTSDSFKLLADMLNHESGVTYVAKRSRVWLVRVQGGIGTIAATTSSAGYIASEVCYIVKSIFKFKYDGDGLAPDIETGMFNDAALDTVIGLNYVDNEA